MIHCYTAQREHCWYNISLLQFTSILQIGCAERRRFDGEHRTEYLLLTARTLVHSPSLLISGATHPTAPAAGDELVRAHHLNKQLLEIPSKSAAPAAIAKLLLLRRPWTTTAAPVPFAQLLLLRRLSHSRALLDRSLILLYCSTLNATAVPTSRSCLGGRYSFLLRTKLVKPPTEIRRIFVGGQRKTASHKNSQIL